MDKQEFWKLAEQRTRENKQLMSGGIPAYFAGAMGWVGLRFWVVGFVVSLTISLYVWNVNYGLIMRMVRGLIWR